MYYTVVAMLMFVFPLASIAIEVVALGGAVGPALVAKWFVFWSVGWRLLLAGIRQIIQPSYTAKEILGLVSDESSVLVRELGFGNVALGVTGLLSLALPAWQMAVALAGGIFYTLAGLGHVAQAHRNRLENVAMVSDLFVGVVLLGACAWSFAGA